MNFDFLLPSTLLRKGREYSRKLWVRVLIMGLLAVLSLLLSMLIERWIPQSLATYLSGGPVAVDHRQRDACGHHLFA